MTSVNSAFNILDSVDSTNNYAMARVHAGLANHGDAYFALQQTGGKGQRGKTWHTGNGQNIALSIVLSPKPLLVSQQFILSALVALGCHDFFSRYAGEETRIKWPNDIYWRDRKAGGILIENLLGVPRAGEPVSSGWKFAVAGIGININEVQFAAGLSRVVSLKQVTGKDFDVVELGRELHHCVLQRFQLVEKVDFSAILETYNAVLFKAGEQVRLKKGDIEFETVINRVMPDGRLFTTDRVDNYFDFGEVEWVWD